MYDFQRKSKIFDHVYFQTKDREVDFDVETAIKVCRSAGYFSHALYLAEKHEEHDWYLKIQLEDIKDYQKALDYIGKLQFSEVNLDDTYVHKVHQYALGTELLFARVQYYVCHFEVDNLRKYKL